MAATALAPEPTATAMARRSPSVTPPDYPGYIKSIIDGGVKIVETAGNNPQKWLPALKEAGIKVINKCTSVRHSLKAQSIGCDAVSVDGFECGGHPGEDDVPNFILLPRAAEELSIPFVASGGMADGRSLVAALSLGADGMNMGTRFIATKEAPVHDNVKQALLAASELDTRLVMRPLRNTERVLRNAAVERLIVALRPSRYVRENAMRALAEIKDSRAIDPTVAVFKDSNNNIRNGCYGCTGPNRNPCTRASDRGPYYREFRLLNGCVG